MEDGIFSLDKNRICIDKSKSLPIFQKRTEKNEFDNLLLAKDMLENYSKISIKGKEYKIKVPKVYSFDDKTQTLNLEFFDGKNLETLIRSINTHKEYVYFLNCIFDFLISNNFNWVDFAPRNILVSNNEICLVDFEKSLNNHIDSLYEYLINHVYEEYSSFLFLHERIFSTDEIFNINNFQNSKIDINQIKIKRIKYLAKHIFDKDIINYKDFLNIWKYILIAEIPFIYNNNFKFPRLFLSKILENKLINEQCYYEYAKIVIELNKANLSINEKNLLLKKLNKF